jgi:glyoxylase-like metal-dependent hydrolase (beta-lactamase superfamily II)
VAEPSGAPAWTGGSFGSVAQCVLAPNASAMTLDGTNTWVLRAPGSSRSVVVDPGPADDGHLAAVADAAGEVAVVLLTHHHLDHSEAARVFAERVGCGVRALDPAYRLGSEGLGEGDVVAVDDLEILVVATPGHTADSLSFVVSSERTVLTGDTVLGRGTSVVAHPDGQLGAYLSSLDRLHALAEAHQITSIWPGHGPVIGSALPVLDHYRAHRRERLEQVREALRTLHAAARDGVPLDHDTLPSRIVEIVYADVDPVLWPAAELSVRAQLDYVRAGKSWR